jgi:hypothetical protein
MPAREFKPRGKTAKQREAELLLAAQRILREIGEDAMLRPSQRMKARQYLAQFSKVVEVELRA